MAAALNWQPRAACRDEDPELFFPAESDTARREAAAAICVTCPVLEQCAAFAVANRISHGIWAARDRERKRGRGRPPAACGTPSGYRRHLRLKEPTCAACRLANRISTKMLPSYRAAHAERVPKPPRVKAKVPSKCQKLTADQVRAIRAASASGQSGRSLAVRYSMSPSQISKIIRREAWVNV